MEKPLNFLIVDDDDIFVYLTKNIIESSGHAKSVEVETSAEKALKMLEQKMLSGDQTPDIILLDIRMPYLNGFEFLERMKKLPIKGSKNPKICMLTSSLNDSDREFASGYSNVIDYITKPFNRTKLGQLVERYAELEQIEKNQ